MNCTLDAVRNNTKFEFRVLYDVYTKLNETCAAGSDIFFKDTRKLTNRACKRMTGSVGSIWKDWTAYPISDVWNRIVVWKLPLLQLLSQFCRPPLGWDVETGIMLHLMGDPIDSVATMFLSLAICQERAAQAKNMCSRAGIAKGDPGYDRTWKGLAIIMVSYDECGASQKIDSFRRTYLRMSRRQDFDSEIRHIYEKTADYLAADRQTKTLPVVLAELIFIGGWVISLVKAASSEPGPTNWVNVEAQSVAISALFLWVTSTVVVSALIGASQTEDSIPRTLLDHEAKLAPFRNKRAVRRAESEWYKQSRDRAINGGTYSWRPTKWKDECPVDVPKTSLLIYCSIGLLFVGCSFFVAATLSWLVSPQGFSCRHIPESITFGIWLLSFVAEVAFESTLSDEILFWVVFWKDMICSLSVVIIILVIQVGIMNSCSCWSRWGATWVHLPQIPEVKGELMYFIRHVAPWIVFGTIVLHFFLCAGVIWWYWDAFRVFIQRDDGESNWPWLRRLWERCWRRIEGDGVEMQRR